MSARLRGKRQPALMTQCWKAPSNDRRRSYSESDSGGIPTNTNSPTYKGRKNPLGEDGKRLRCFECQSEYHMRDKCDKLKEDDKKETIGDKKKKFKKEKKKGKDSPVMLTTFLQERKTELVMISRVVSTDTCAKNVFKCKDSGRELLVSKDLETQFLISKDSEKQVLIYEDSEEQLLISKDSEKELLMSTKKHTEELVLATHIKEELCLLVDEAGEGGILDSACSKFVTGWRGKYCEKLPEEISSVLKLEKSVKITSSVKNS